MSVAINRTVTIKDREGNVITLDEKEQAQTRTTVTVTCDGPRCSRLVTIDNTAALPASYTWTEEEVKKDPMALPDNVVRFLILASFDGSVKNVFCCPRCLADHMLNYVPPKSPREKAAEAAANPIGTPQATQSVNQFINDVNKNSR